MRGLQRDHEGKERSQWEEEVTVRWMDHQRSGQADGAEAGWETSIRVG